MAGKSEINEMAATIEVEFQRVFGQKPCNPPYEIINSKRATIPLTWTGTHGSKFYSYITIGLKNQTVQMHPIRFMDGVNNDSVVNDHAEYRKAVSIAKQILAGKKPIIRRDDSDGLFA